MRCKLGRMCGVRQILFLPLGIFDSYVSLIQNKIFFGTLRRILNLTNLAVTSWAFSCFLSPGLYGRGLRPCPLACFFCFSSFIPYFVLSSLVLPTCISAVHWQDFCHLLFSFLYPGNPQHHLPPPGTNHPPCPPSFPIPTGLVRPAPIPTKGERHV